MNLSEKLLRQIFLGLIALTVMLMTILSFQYGITGDEIAQNANGEGVLKYYTSLGKDTTCLNFPKNVDRDGVLKYYGTFFDLSAAAFNEVSPFSTYDTRHILNAWFGILTMIFTALLARFLTKSYGAAVIAFALLLFSPRFFGHAMNNPKDISFAMGYVMGLLSILRLVQKLPKPEIKDILFTVVAIGIAVNTRIGGVLLIAYLFMFGGTNYLLNHISIKGGKIRLNLNLMGRYIMYMVIVSLGAYIFAIIFWPYALQDPINNPLNSLDKMSNFAVNIRQLFEGKMTRSNELPWYYLPKYILITAPEIVTIGFGLFIVLIYFLRKKSQPIYLFYVIFAALFPLLYVLYKDSNVYGGWRHLMFIYPPIIALSAVAWHHIIQIQKSNVTKSIVIGTFSILLILPVQWMIRNHPHQVTYFNTVFGGVKKAYGNYELDYYLNSLKAATNWLIKSELKNNNKPIVIASNAPPQIKEYFKDYENVKITYVRYYERSQKEWDYAILANFYVDVFQLKRKIFPPKGTIHQETADKKPLSIVVKRENKADFRGFQAMKQNNFPEAEKQFRNALAYDKNNEQAWFGLANASINQRKIDQAYKALDQSLKLYPTYLSALNSLGMLYMRQNKFNEAILTYSKMLEINAGNAGAYYYRGLAYANTNHPNEAIQDLSMAAAVNGGLKKNAYNEIAKIYGKTGNQEMARKYLEEANK